MLLPLSGHIEWWTGRCPGRCGDGVIFPPWIAYLASSTVGHISVFIDPWFQELGPGRHDPIVLDHPTARHLRALWSKNDLADLDEDARETVAYLRRQGVLPPAVPIDPRVAAALQDLPAADCVDHLAARVGLSPSRLRALIHDLTGVPPSRLRLWRRLRIAIASLPDKPIALAAADAGFADQAHLTRTATRLVGQTPGELARVLVATQRTDRAAAGGVPVDCLARLWRRVDEAYADPGMRRRTAAAVPGLVEPLTARELEVLGQLAAGRSNQRIAEEFVVTLDTVKKHVSRVLDKLGATNRTEAVVRARECGLIN
jgi:DNA-binding CsgD family transcriptional regulator